MYAESVRRAGSEPAMQEFGWRFLAKPQTLIHTQTLEVLQTHLRDVLVRHHNFCFLARTEVCEHPRL